MQFINGNNIKMFRIFFFSEILCIFCKMKCIDYKTLHFKKLLSRNCNKRLCAEILNVAQTLKYETDCNDTP